MKENCPRCNQPVFEFAEVCQVCGCELESTAFADFSDQNNIEDLQQLIKDGLTPCVIRVIQRANNYTFITVKKFENYDFFGCYADAYNEFYVFKTQNYPNFRSQGQHIVFDLKNFEYFVTDNHVKIYYLRSEMSVFDILDLKSYNFNKG